MTASGRLSWFTLTLAAVVLAGATGSRPVAAQQFKTLDMKIDAKQANGLLGPQVANALRQGSSGAEDVKKIDDFFKSYFFPAMTSTDPVALGRLNGMRSQFFQRYMNIATGAARQQLVNVTLQYCNGIATGAFHPASRFNAALMLGQLEQAPGKPMPEGTEALLALLENDQIKNVEVPTALKVAALVSLERQIKTGLDPKYADRITTGALAVINRESLPDDASAEAYGWVQRQAAAVLAAQQAAGMTAPVLAGFVKLVGDDALNLDDRCGVAALLDPKMFQEAKGLNVGPMALVLGNLAQDVLNKESEDADEYLKKSLAAGGLTAGGGFGGGMGGGYGEMRGGGYGEGGGYGRGGIGRGGGGYGEGGYGRGGGYGGGMDIGMMMQDQGPNYEKRRMLDRTRALVKAAEAVAAAGPDDQTKRLTEFATAIRTVAQSAAAKDAVTADVADAVTQLASDVDAMVASWAPPEAAAPDEKVPAEPPADEPAPAAAAPAAETAGA
jgi:hypothetical protein